MMGDIHYCFSRGKKKLLIHNFQTVLGERLNGRPVSELAQNYFRNHYVNQLQIFLFPRFTRKNIGNFHRIEGLEYLEDGLKKGKGCILVHPHFGPAQLPLCALGIMGYPMMQLGLPTDEGLGFIGKKVAFRLRMKYEGKIPAMIISADSFLKPVVKWLKSNKVVMITGDGAGGGKFIGKFIPVDFFGRSAMFPVGAARLAQKTGAMLLPLFTIIEKDNTYKTIIHEPLKVNCQQQDIESGEAITIKFIKKMENYVEQYPFLWHFWDEVENRFISPE
jgi:KDO2-lipid IV(A) lauroyltransferase